MTAGEHEWMTKGRYLKVPLFQMRQCASWKWKCRCFFPHPAQACLTQPDAWCLFVRGRNVAYTSPLFYHTSTLNSHFFQPSILQPNKTRNFKPQPPWHSKPSSPSSSRPSSASPLAKSATSATPGPSVPSTTPRRRPSSASRCAAARHSTASRSTPSRAVSSAPKTLPSSAARTLATSETSLPPGRTATI